MDTTQAFFKAIKTGDLASVQALLATDPALVNTNTRTGESAVLLAVYYMQSRQIISPLFMKLHKTVKQICFTFSSLTVLMST